MKERLVQLIKDHGLKHWSFAARKDQEFISWVDRHTPADLLHLPFAQRVYAATSGESLVCEKGNIKGFDSIERGFRFCGRAGKCPCAAASVSKKCKENIDHESRLEKSRRGLLQKHGVTNPGQTEKAKAAHQAFYQDKKKVDDAIEKGRNTLFRNHGSYSVLDIIGINREEVSQRNWSTETKEIISDKERFIEFVSNRSRQSAANMLGVWPGTIVRYCNLYGIDLVEQSSFETEIAHFLAENGISFRQRVRTIARPFELDFYLDDLKIGIEFNGLYWHSDQIVPKNYHLDKWKACKDVGVRLIMIYEDEWLEKTDIVKKKILTICGKSKRGKGARKLTIERIASPPAKVFIQNHHLQGAPGNIVGAYAAFDDNEMVACLTFGRQRRTSALELTRFCTNGYLYAGVFSRLLSRARRDFPEEIVTFADLRYSDGNLYYKCGFSETGIIPPDYKYVKRLKTFHKSLFTKDRITKMGFDISGKTEREAMKEMGYSRIYDIGKIRFVLR